MFFQQFRAGGCLSYVIGCERTRAAVVGRKLGATGRTDLPTGDPEQLFDSIFDGLLHLGDDVLVYPAHDYKGRESSTIGRERAENPLAAAALKEMGFNRAVALDGGFKAWRESDFPLTEGDS